MFKYQGKLIEKITSYLEHELQISTKISPNSEDTKNRAEVVKYFKESGAGGVCVGLATLWAHAKRIEEEPTDKPNDRDDMKFLDMIGEKLIKWDEKQGFSKAEKANIDRFISNIILYQEPARKLFEGEDPEILEQLEYLKKLGMKNLVGVEGDSLGQLALSTSMQDTKRGSPTQAFKQKFIATKKGMEHILPYIIKPRTMIHLGVKAERDVGHAMSIYQRQDGKIFFYDPNNGEFEFDKVKDLVKKLWSSSNLPSDGPAESDLKKFEVDIFKFESDPIYQYPSKEEFKKAKKGFEEILNFPNIHYLKSQRGSRLKSALLEFDDNEIITLLKGNDVSPSGKNFILDYFKSFIEFNNKKRYEIISKTETKHENEDIFVLKNLDPYDNLSLKEIEEKALKFKKELNLKDILIILNVNPDIELAKKLFEAQERDSKPNLKLDNEEIIEQFENTLNDISDKNVGLAKFILENFNKKFGIIPDETRLYNEEIQDFVKEIKKNNPINKNEFIQEIKTFLNDEVKDEAKRELLVHKATKIAKELNPTEALHVLAINPGKYEEWGKEILYSANREKLKYEAPSTLLNNIVKNTDSELLKSLETVILKNIETGHLEDAKQIIEDVGNKFVTTPNIEMLKKFNDESLVNKALYDNRHLYTNKEQEELRKFGENSAANKLNKNELMTEIKLLHDHPMYYHEKRDALTDRADKFAKELNPTEALQVLAINPGQYRWKYLHVFLEQINHNNIDVEDKKLQDTLKSVISTNLALDGEHTKDHGIRDSQQILYHCADKWKLFLPLEVIKSFGNGLDKFMIDRFSIYREQEKAASIKPQLSEKLKAEVAVIMEEQKNQKQQFEKDHQIEIKLTEIASNIMQEHLKKHGDDVKYKQFDYQKTVKDLIEKDVFVKNNIVKFDKILDNSIKLAKDTAKQQKTNNPVKI